MRLTRRKFLGKTVGSGAGLTALRVLGPGSILAALPGNPANLNAKEERMAFTPATAYRPYESKPADSADEITWVQVDLGSSQPIDAVKLFPALDLDWDGVRGFGFPVRFKIEASDDPQFRTAQFVVDHTSTDWPSPGDKITRYATRGVKGRYVRLTATRLRLRKPKVYDLALSQTAASPTAISWPTPRTRSSSPNVPLTRVPG